MTLRQITLKWQEYSITFTEWIKERPELITMATEVHIQVKFVRLWYNCLGERQAWVESYSGRIKVGDLEGLDGGPQLQGQPECHYQVEPASTLTIKKNSRLLIIITLLLCQIFTISKNMFRKQIFSEQSTTLHTWHMPTFLEERWMNLIHFLLHRIFINWQKSNWCNNWYFQIKNNSMKKLAATTLMEILPEEMQNMVNMISVFFFPWILKRIISDIEKVGGGSLNVTWLLDNYWPCLLLLEPIAVAGPKMRLRMKDSV